MKLDRKDLLLYAVTDKSWSETMSLEKQVEQAIEAGVTFLQLREKNLKEEDLLKEAFYFKELAKKYKIPFIINDNVEIAKKCDADGVHVGQKDMEAVKAREILGDNKLIGVSVQTVEQARLAENQGADYLGVGSVFTTSTKEDAKLVSYTVLKEICQSVTIPIVAIGGISTTNMEKLKGSGIDGVAVVSAIFASKDIKRATKELLEKAKDIVNE